MNGLKKKIKELKKTHANFIEYGGIVIGYKTAHFMESCVYNLLADEVRFPKVKFGKDFIHMKIGAKDGYYTYKSIIGIELNKISDKNKTIKLMIAEFRDRKKDQVFS